ncbi:putative lipoprotein [Janthinobacterium agaricidamnosum NBRC 102515 = DSM 9628]|uniref:Putative lipoprotein n=1 Tax=Janthinobacterium agaricidamnosum NBRC 102515 = DSM 9628 TaxID=1349767 RepID=W0VAQ7_9BURK|nr:putative lipoprotein [Janthinobacterium agaricidamnosum NBRC 102515 = DSM 9628]
MSRPSASGLLMQHEANIACDQNSNEMIADSMPASGSFWQTSGMAATA